MGYLMLLGECGACGQLFMSNPDWVPSIRLADGRQLIFCRPCVEASAPARAQNGLPPIDISPLAYEPVDA